jgi:hypothetical protein
MGVKPFVIWICWTIRSFVFYLFWTIVISIFITLRVSVSKDDLPKYLLETKALLYYTNFLVVFVTLLVYSIQITCLILLVGQIFRKSEEKKNFNLFKYISKN